MEKGDRVYLRGKNVRTERPNPKLEAKLLGPFLIEEEVGTHARRLQLPPTMKIHNVFHLDLLEPCRVRPESQAQGLQDPVVEPMDEEWSVYEILDCKWTRQGRGPWEKRWLVDWEGFGPHERTWEPRGHLTHCDEALRIFHEAYPEKPGPRPDAAAQRPGPTAEGPSSAAEEPAAPVRRGRGRLRGGGRGRS